MIRCLNSTRSTTTTCWLWANCTRRVEWFTPKPSSRRTGRSSNEMEDDSPSFWSTPTFREFRTHKGLKVSVAYLPFRGATSLHVCALMSPSTINTRRSAYLVHYTSTARIVHVAISHRLSSPRTSIKQKGPLMPRAERSWAGVTSTPPGTERRPRKIQFKNDRHSLTLS